MNVQDEFVEWDFVRRRGSLTRGNDFLPVWVANGRRWIQGSDLARVLDLTPAAVNGWWYRHRHLFAPGLISVVTRIAQNEPEKGMRPRAGEIRMFSVEGASLLYGMVYNSRVARFSAWLENETVPEPSPVDSEHPCPDEWLLVVETLLAEIQASRFKTFRFERMESGRALAFRPRHVMDHMRSHSHLRSFWESLQSKSDRVLKKQLAAAGMLQLDATGNPLGVERVIVRRRVSNLVVLNLEALEQRGVNVRSFLGTPSGDHE